MGYSAYETFAFQTLHPGSSGCLVLATASGRQLSLHVVFVGLRTEWSKETARLCKQPKCCQRHSGPASTFQLKHLIWHTNKTFLKTLILENTSFVRTPAARTCNKRRPCPEPSVRTQFTTKTWPRGSDSLTARMGCGRQPRITRIIACEISSWEQRVACAANHKQQKALTVAAWNALHFSAIQTSWSRLLFGLSVYHLRRLRQCMRLNTASLLTYEINLPPLHCKNAFTEGSLIEHERLAPVVSGSPSYRHVLLYQYWCRLSRSTLWHRAVRYGNLNSSPPWGPEIAQHLRTIVKCVCGDVAVVTFYTPSADGAWTECC